MALPTLLVVSGPPGAGKTTLAKALAETLGWPVACRDEIKERMVADEAGPADQLDLMALAGFFERLRVLLRAGSSAIAEAAYQDRLWRPGLVGSALPRSGYFARLDARAGPDRRVRHPAR